MEKDSLNSSDFDIESVNAALEQESSLEAFFKDEREESIEAGRFVLDTLRQHGLLSSMAESFIAQQDGQLPIDELYFATRSLETEDGQQIDIEDPIQLLREMGIVATLASAYLFYKAGGPDQIRAEVEADLLDTYEVTATEFSQLTPVLDVLFDSKQGLSFDNIESYELFEKTKEANAKRIAVQVLKEEITPIMAVLFSECMEEGLLPPAHDDIQELFASMAGTLHYERVHGITEDNKLLLTIRWENIQSIANRMGLDEETVKNVSERLKIAYDLY